MKIGERLVSRNDLHYLIELINSSLSSMSEKGIRDLIVDLGRLIPYEFTFAARFNSSSPTDSYHMVNVSYPPEWLDLYISNRFDKVDPVIREHLLNPRVQYWDDTYRKYPDARHFISLSHDFGLKAGYSCGLRSHDGTTMSLFSLSARSMECHPRTRLILSYALPVLDPMPGPRVVPCEVRIGATKEPFRKRNRDLEMGRRRQEQVGNIGHFARRK